MLVSLVYLLLICFIVFSAFSLNPVVPYPTCMNCYEAVSKDSLTSPQFAWFYLVTFSSIARFPPLNNETNTFLSQCSPHSLHLCIVVFLRSQLHLPFCWDRSLLCFCCHSLQLCFSSKFLQHLRLLVVIASVPFEDVLRNIYIFFAVGKLRSPLDQVIFILYPFFDDIICYTEFFQFYLVALDSC